MLLDNFISASSRVEQEERLAAAELHNRQHLQKNPLEPLLLKLAREFSDSQDLSEKLQTMYQVSSPLTLRSSTSRSPVLKLVQKLKQTRACKLGESVVKVLFFGQVCD